MIVSNRADVTALESDTEGEVSDWVFELVVFVINQMFTKYIQ